MGERAREGERHGGGVPRKIPRWFHSDVSVETEAVLPLQRFTIELCTRSTWPRDTKLQKDSAPFPEEQLPSTSLFPPELIKHISSNIPITTCSLCGTHWSFIVSHKVLVVNMQQCRKVSSDIDKPVKKLLNLVFAVVDRSFTEVKVVVTLSV